MEKQTRVVFSARDRMSLTLEGLQDSMHPCLICQQPSMQGCEEHVDRHRVTSLSQRDSQGNWREESVDNDE